MSVIIHISWAVFYEFDGWKFEYNRRKPLGPWPVKNDLEPKARAGAKFYEMFGKFSALSVDERERYRI